MGVFSLAREGEFARLTDCEFGRFFLRRRLTSATIRTIFSVSGHCETQSLGRKTPARQAAKSSRNHPDHRVTRPAPDDGAGGKNIGASTCGSSGATPRQSVGLCGHRVPHDTQRDPQPGRLGRLPARRHRGARGVEPGRERHPRAEVFPQGRRAGAAEEGRGERRPVLAVALGPRRGGARRRCPRTSATPRETDARQVFDRLAGTWTYWGWKGGYFDTRGGRPRLLRRAALHARHPEGGAQLAAMVQHRPALGLWHRRPEPGPFLRRLQDRRAARAPSRAYEHPQPHACFIQSHRRRPRQRGRHHGPVGARGAPVQIRLGHRLQFLARCAAKARSSPAAASRPA